MSYPFSSLIIGPTQVLGYFVGCCVGRGLKLPMVKDEKCPTKKSDVVKMRDGERRSGIKKKT